MIPRKIIITGASGLLGTAVSERLARAGYELIRLANRNVFPGTRNLDLNDPAALKSLAKSDWDAIVHCAAHRSPDFCEENRRLADRLNTAVPTELAEIAAQRAARMVHISTDYVFDGRNPPYCEDAPPDPVNYYGETKLKAEIGIRERYPSAAILRIPALYGDPPAPLTSTLLEEAIAAMNSRVPVSLDDTIVRFPTFTEHIADVVAFLLEAGHAQGIIHASAPERATRYEFAIWIGRLLDRDISHVGRADRDAGRKARRPLNSQLGVDRLKELGGPIPRGYSEVLPNMAKLAKYRSA